MAGWTMQCPKCAYVNVEDARFCSNCGTSLSSGHTAPATPAAPTVSEAAPDDLARYVPPELLSKIRAAQAGQTMRGERRTVTMLFADIQGSTAAAEHLDPEEWAEIMNGAFGHLIAPVYRYEGTLARLQGDAILAFFGAPIAHEDDPVRAVRAGLDIVEDLAPYAAEVEQRYRIPISVRVGINTGLVVVGEVGSDLRVEYTALGDAINVAARMEQTAAPGTVRIAEQTLRLLTPAFDVLPVGPVEVKGKSEPVPAHRVVAYRLRAEADRSASTPLVGRGAEMTRLREVVATLDTGTGGIVVLSGEAGVGKSRLLRALRDEIAADRTLARAAHEDGDLSWMRGRARSYERVVPYAAFVDLLRTWLDDDRSEGETCFHRLADAYVRATGNHDADRIGFLTELLGEPLPSDQARLVGSLSTPVLHERTIDAACDYLVAEARRRPVLLALDDLHWADDMSLTLDERLMEATATAPLTLLLGMRPTGDEPSWHLVELADREYAFRHTAIDLDALTQDATEELLALLLGSLQVDEELRGAILEHANGNPLFVEELVRSLGEKAGGDGATRSQILGRKQIDVPPSLSGLLTSRLDQLDDATRQVAQIASVVGRGFDVPTLAGLVEAPDGLDARTAELVERGIFERLQGADDPVYAFRHPLIQETAYSTVLLRTRRELHARVARHLVAHDGDASHEIARHFLAAGDPGSAFPYLVASGRKASRAMALRDAITYFTVALESPPDGADPELMLAAHDGLGEACSLVPDLSKAAATFQSLLDYGKAAGSPAMQVTALNRLGFNTAALGGDFTGAMRYLGQARALAQEIGDELGMAEYHMNACFVSSFQGDYGDAVEHDSETVRIGRQTGDRSMRLTGLFRKTINLIALSRFEEAEEAYEEAISAARELGSDEVEAVLQCNAAAVFALRDGDVLGAVELLRRGAPELDRYASFYSGPAHHWFGEAAGHLGEIELALAAYASTERHGRAFGQPFSTAAGLAGQARVLALCGRSEDVPALRDEAIELVGTFAGGFFGASVWANLAVANLHAGDLERAAADLEAAQAASGVTALWERPRIIFCRARLALLCDDLPTVRAALERARELVSTYRIRLHDAELALLDGMLAAAEGRNDDAVAELTGAVDATARSGRALTRIEALARLATVHDQQGATDEAAGRWHEAQDEVIRLAGIVADEELREGFTRTQLGRIAAFPSSSP